MYMDWHYANQELRKQDLAEKVAERNLYALAGGLRRRSLRARAARFFFALAVAVEKQEAWRMAREG